MTPRLDGAMVSSEENLRHFPAFVIRRAGVVGVVEETVGKGILLRGLVIAEHAGQEAHHGIGDNQRGKHAAGEDVVADGNLVIDQVVRHALVDALVVAAEQNEVAFAREVAGHGIREFAALRGHEDDFRVRRAEGGEGFVDGFDFHDHARSAAIGGIVHCAVGVAGPLAQVHRFEAGDAFFARAFENAGLEHGAADVREDGEDLDFQGR